MAEKPSQRITTVSNKINVQQQARIQDSEGGVSYIQKGGGGVRTGISGADPNCCRALGKSTSKKKLQTALGGGGGPMTKKKTCIRAWAVCVRFFMQVVTIEWMYYQNGEKD